MKRFLKFIGWAVVVVMGGTFANYWFSWAGELISTKNSFAVAAGLMMVGVGLGTGAWVAFTVIRAAGRAMFDWQDREISSFGRPSKSCCQNECGCDRSKE